MKNLHPVFGLFFAILIAALLLTVIYPQRKITKNIVKTSNSVFNK